MCGIAGIYDPDRHPGLQEVKPMVDIIVHRGPDSDGFLVEPGVAMGMRRLSIIDLAGGTQPIFNEDGTVGVVFNGEIFNYRELGDYLIGRGHRFVTHSDTEMLVHLYEEHGTGMFPYLNGMFGFAIWDRKRRSLLVGRDRMGVKPIYYLQNGSRTLFASELKSFLPCPELDTGKLDTDSIADFLRLCYVPREHSAYRQVRRLLPGHYMLLEPGRTTVQAWWDLASPPKLEIADLESDLEKYFNDAVKLRMRSDVPVASFLSGGLDSSLVTVAAQRESKIPINTFTLGFANTQFDETPYARAVAEQAHTQHNERTVTPGDAVSLLPKLLWHMDEPMGDSSVIPNFLVSQFAAEKVKVCLSGLGGDELFGGYARYVEHGPGRLRSLFEPAPMLAGALAPVVGLWSHPHSQELRLAADPRQAWQGYLQKIQIFHNGSLQAIRFPSQGRAESVIEQLWHRYPGNDPVTRRQFVDQHTYLPDQILALADRMSMANSLEVRVPFMDYRLVLLAQQVPAALKQNAKDFKILLKKVFGKTVPDKIVNRPKWGFDTPLSRWVRSPEIYPLFAALERGEAAKLGLFDPKRIARYTGTPESAGRYARSVWNLLVLEVWLRVRARKAPPTETLAQLLAA